MEDFTHFNTQGKAKMVDVGEKEISHRRAVAAAAVKVNAETFRLIQTGGMKGGCADGGTDRRCDGSKEDIRADSDVSSDRYSRN